MGLLRPATPLSVLFFVAFVLLLLSTLSTPIIPAIPLGNFDGFNFGVFGYCKGSTCSKFKLGYSTDNLFPDSSNKDFELSSTTRHSLSSLLVVHPIAAFLSLVCFGLAVAAHFHAAAHSPRYLLALLILTIPTLLITLLAFLVDILLFVPHMSWGGWIVLAATILIVASSVVTCAMRRTLVSRKARKKRIAENSDMNGTEYYATLGQQRMMADELPRADSPPPMSGSTVTNNNGPQFASYEMHKPDTMSLNGTAGRRSVDDQTPLNPRRDPSIRSASTGGGPRTQYGPHDGPPPMPMDGRHRTGSGTSMGPSRQPSRDQYGNPIPLSAAMVMAGDLPPPGLRSSNSQGSLRSDGSGGYHRGRGGYGPPGRGRGYGPPRGAYGPPGRGNYGPRGAYRGQGPPPGWNGRGRGAYNGPPPPMMGRGGMPRNGPPPGYNGDDIPAYYSSPRNAPSPPMMRQPQASSSPPPPPPPPVHDEFIAGPIGPIGQAIEMDERTGSSSTRPDPSGYPSPQFGLRDSDGDVAGMVGLQQNGQHPPRTNTGGSGEGRSPTSIYSENNYIPARAQWGPSGPQNSYGTDGPVSPIEGDHFDAGPSYARPPPGPAGLSPIEGSPSMARGPKRGPAEQYYEDVDPRFAIDPASDVGSDHNTALPSALTPGGGYPGAARAHRMPSPNHLHPFSSIPSYTSNTSSGVGSADGGRPHNPLLDRPLDETDAYDQLPEGARSPGEGSETSHFTSVSQRSINPNWRPGPGPGPGPGYGGPAAGAAAAQRRRDDVILTANPDFSLPGMTPGRTRGGSGGGGGPGGPGGPSSVAPLGLTPSGRYPTDI